MTTFTTASGQTVTYQFRMMSDQNLLSTFYTMLNFGNPNMNWPEPWQIRLCQIVFESNQPDNSNFTEALNLFNEDPEYYGLTYTD